MTNKEKYKQAFSVLHTSDISEGEVKYMAKLKKRQKMKLAAAAIAVCVIVGGTGTAYAANVGGIQRTIQLWMHGDQTSATLDLNTDDGSYSLEYKDTDGNTVTQGGGCVAFDADGNERPLTEDEIMEELNAPDVEYLDDSSVWVYYKNQKIEELTDLIKEINNKNYAAILQDGSVIIAYDSFDGLAMPLFAVDVNGKKGPNTPGEDLFNLSIY